MTLQSLLQPDKAPKLPKTNREKDSAQRLIFVLSQASLETVKTGAGKDGRYSLLNCDDHHHILNKNKKDPSHYRPDITHQVILLLLLLLINFHSAC